MNDDPKTPAAEREPGRRTIAAGPARTQVVRVTVGSPASVVWDACTEPGQLERWFQPVTGELRIGGTFALADGVSGEIVQCDPPHLLTFTWVVGDGPVDEVQLRLRDDGDGTELEIEHASAAEDAAHIAGVGAGWEQLVTDALPRHIAGGSGAPPTGP